MSIFKLMAKPAICLFFIIVNSGTISAQQLPYQNADLPFEARAGDLLHRLSLEEKVMLMQDASRPIPRLNIKPYNWWNEALHGVARAGLATVFPQPIGMAATFDSAALRQVYIAVADEARAKHNYYRRRGSTERYQGLTMWTPTINIFRDPRWGRGIETYGEDPYLTSILGVAVVRGLQDYGHNNKYDKLHACAKHFAVHSGPEWNRHSFNAANIKPRDLYETYLPAFEALVKQANVMEVMCAYNRFEGKPCCGSDELLMQILRKKWGFQGIVVADCGAIADFYKDNAHGTHADAATASAAAVLSGTDLDCGSSYQDLVKAVSENYIKQADIDISVRRLLIARFRLGEMDDPALVSWNNINPDVIASAQHNQLALDMARKSMTLLMNKNNILPLAKGKKRIAVMGPNANDSIMQWGNYNGTPARTITILEGIKAALGPTDQLIYEPGTGLVENTLMRSAFNQCSSGSRNGFQAHYWNNKERSGAPVATDHISSPFSFCTSGATVFAPKVKLTGFSASYSSTFKPQQAGAVVFDFYVNGILTLWINGKEVKTAKTGHGSRKVNYTMDVSAGQPYTIRIDFTQHSGDAQLNFDMGYKELIDVEKSLAKVADADVVIFAGGIAPSLEGEEMGVNFEGFKHGDRISIELPAVQRTMIAALKKAGKKVVFVNCSGSPIGMVPEVNNTEAILQAWYPGQAGGEAVADVLFGKFNPSGRLPVTFYRDTTQLPDFENYDMQGRTYRYMTQKPLFSFGYGLSYSTFKYGAATLSSNVLAGNEPVSLEVPVTNSSKINGDEIVQLYLRKKDDVPGPVKTLRAVKRVAIKAGSTQKVKFSLQQSDFTWYDEKLQDMAVVPGSYLIYVGKSSREEDLQQLDISLQ